MKSTTCVIDAPPKLTYFKQRPRIRLCQAAGAAAVSKGLGAARGEQTVGAVSLTASSHQVEELVVIFGRLHILEHQFHRFDFVHVVHKLSQYP